MFRSVGTRTVHFARRRWRWIVATLVLPVALLVAADVFATKTEIKGRLDNPKASTWEVLVNLIRNAFFKAILPGFDEELTRLARG